MKMCIRDSVWGGSSPSTSFDCSGFVSYVLTSSGLCNIGRLDVYKRQGKMLLHGAPKLDENGKPVRNRRGRIIYEPYRIKVLNTINFSKSMKYNPLALSLIHISKQRITESEIIKYMVGREMENVYPKRGAHEFGAERFRIKNWSVYDPAAGREILHDINLYVREGEIVGLAGLMGAGRTELALSLFGNTPGYQITSGELVMDGKRVRFKSSSDAIDAGVAYATEDRKHNGLVLIQDIRFNTTFANLKSLVKNHVIRKNEEIVQAEKLKRELGIKAPSIQQKTVNLSGGNQQKVVLAKWIFANPKLLILDEPTRGIDVGAKYEIYSLMNEMVKRGMSIIMISSELLEILGMSDRVYVMCEGRLTGELPIEQATEQSIMRLATNTEESVL